MNRNSTMFAYFKKTTSKNIAQFYKSNEPASHGSMKIAVTTTLDLLLYNVRLH